MKYVESREDANTAQKMMNNLALKYGEANILVLHPGLIKTTTDTDHNNESIWVEKIERFMSGDKEWVGVTKGTALYIKRELDSND
ncbi:hypothetical protein M8332_07075 (plasmid) [Fructilactobacillus ixorae]|uniref:Uncharacterized protein n=1 Tax=Fructilactobacillus ixorae TaxID=1750535 RepID=A0ABY5C8S2_9LACO|nr:hypothetical protein [Fructilactobacillus ixorae]USS93978.1 hypothetical protein M8332_07075 [Fructilactobacillus ixorae]